MQISVFESVVHLSNFFSGKNVSATLFSSPEHKVLRVSYCDRSLSVVRRRPSSVVRRP